MIRLLAFRHLLVRPVRSLFLLGGFGVGVATMLILLSVGRAMVLQSRDVTLLGGGEVTVLPLGIDFEALRTGALSEMFYGIDRAWFVDRQLLSGPRQTGMVRAASPVIEGKVIHLAAGNRVMTVSAGGEIPSRAALVGRALDVRVGAWRDSEADSTWFAPRSQQLYDRLDRFHLPPGRDSTWGEWHYFNVMATDQEWWYLSYMVGGDIRGGQWGGRLLATLRRRDGRYQEFRADFPPELVRFDTATADLALGDNLVHQRSGLYFLEGQAEEAEGRVLRFSLTVRPEPRRYFPPLEIQDGAFISGYVVPALRATVSGRLCVEGDCTELAGAPGYHDHNWGIWRGVTWEWGQGRGASLDFLYGGMLSGEAGGEPRVPFLLAVVDSLGLLQVLRFDRIEVETASPVAGAPTVEAPSRFILVGRRERDSVSVTVDQLDVHPSTRESGPVFLQMRGRFRLSGVIGGVPLADSGVGFFETYRPAASP